MAVLNGKALKDWLKSRVVNNLLTTEKGFWLDARIGPAIQQDIDDLRKQADEINSNLNDLITVKRFSASASVKKNEGAELYIPIEKIAGYSAYCLNLYPFIQRGIITNFLEITSKPSYSVRFYAYSTVDYTDVTFRVYVIYIKTF